MPRQQGMSKISTRLPCLSALAIFGLVACAADDVPPGEPAPQEDPSTPAPSPETKTPTPPAPPPSAKPPEAKNNAPACLRPSDKRALPSTVGTPTWNVCTPERIVAIKGACLGPNATKAQCDAARAQVPACAACLFGDASQFVGAYFEGGFPVANVWSCMSAAQGNACTAPIGRFLACVTSVCKTCNTHDTWNACLDHAVENDCNALDPGKACREVMKDGEKGRPEDLKGACFASAASDTFAKVANMLCGTGMVLDDGGPAIAH